MLTILIIVALGALVYITVNQIIKSKSERSIDLSETLLPETNIHEEIAKTAKEIKEKEPIVIKTPFGDEKRIDPKPKKQKSSSKKETLKKSVPKTKATPKKKSTTKKIIKK